MAIAVLAAGLAFRYVQLALSTMLASPTGVLSLLAALASARFAVKALLEEKERAKEA